MVARLASVSAQVRPERWDPRAKWRREGGKRLLHRLEKQTQGKDKVARKKAEIGRNRTQKIRKRYRRLNVKKLLSEINIDVLVCILNASNYRKQARFWEA